MASSDVDVDEGDMDSRQKDIFRRRVQQNASDYIAAMNRDETSGADDGGAHDTALALLDGDETELLSRLAANGDVSDSTDEAAECVAHVLSAADDASFDGLEDAPELVDGPDAIKQPTAAEAAVFGDDIFSAEPNGAPTACKFTASLAPQQPLEHVADPADAAQNARVLRILEQAKAWSQAARADPRTRERAQRAITLELGPHLDKLQELCNRHGVHVNEKLVRLPTVDEVLVAVMLVSTYPPLGQREQWDFSNPTVGLLIEGGLYELVQQGYLLWIDFMPIEHDSCKRRKPKPPMYPLPAEIIAHCELYPRLLQAIRATVDQTVGRPNCSLTILAGKSTYDSLCGGIGKGDRADAQGRTETFPGAVGTATAFQVTGLTVGIPTPNEAREVQGDLLEAQDYKIRIFRAEGGSHEVLILVICHPSSVLYAQDHLELWNLLYALIFDWWIRRLCIILVGQAALDGCTWQQGKYEYYYRAAALSEYCRPCLGLLRRKPWQRLLLLRVHLPDLAMSRIRGRDPLLARYIAARFADVQRHEMESGRRCPHPENMICRAWWSVVMAGHATMRKYGHLLLVDPGSRYHVASARVPGPLLRTTHQDSAMRAAETRAEFDVELPIEPGSRYHFASARAPGPVLVTTAEVAGQAGAHTQMVNKTEAHQQQRAQAAAASSFPCILVGCDRVLPTHEALYNHVHDRQGHGIRKHVSDGVVTVFYCTARNHADCKYRTKGVGGDGLLAHYNETEIKFPLPCMYRAKGCKETYYNPASRDTHHRNPVLRGGCSYRGDEDPQDGRQNFYHQIKQQAADAAAAAGGGSGTGFICPIKTCFESFATQKLLYDHVHEASAGCHGIRNAGAPNAEGVWKTVKFTCEAKGHDDCAAKPKEMGGASMMGHYNQTAIKLVLYCRFKEAGCDKLYYNPKTLKEHERKCPKNSDAKKEQARSKAK